MQEVLVIDDAESIRDLLSEFLKEHGFEVSGAADGQAGLDLLKQRRFDLFFVDLVMPGMGGIDLLREARDLGIHTPAVVITGFGTIQTAVEAMRLGAYDYITKPFILEELLMTVNRALEYYKLQRENASLKRQLKDKYNFRKMIGNSLPMQKLYRVIEKVADTDSTVMIFGESGTGKELVARTIHFNSPRANGHFVPVNCGAIPRDLIESELFGHEKGAFTGATSMRIGRFELANGGTIFLDEIGELPPALQVKLLRVLQEREFERVGGARTIRVDVRILAATNRDLGKATRDGGFREDLYYRLNVIPLRVPPLREREDDIPLLLDHFMAEFCRKRKKTPLRIAPDAAEILKRYPWPGNVRELENAIERMVILNDRGTITIDDLPDHVRKDARPPARQAPATGEEAPGLPVSLQWTPSGIDLNGVLDELERGLILQALDKSGGVKNKAAALLGLNRTTLIEKIKKKGLSARSAD